MDDDSGYSTPPPPPLPQKLQTPKRPRRMIDINASVPSSSGAPDDHDHGQKEEDDEDSCTSSSSSFPKQKKNHLKNELVIVTWNVWFGDHYDLYQVERFKYIINLILSINPDVACFQEVNGTFLKLLKSNHEIITNYYLSTNPIYEEYGILSILKKELKKKKNIPHHHHGSSSPTITTTTSSSFSSPTFVEIDLPTRMGRSLLITQIDLSIIGHDDENDDDKNDDDQDGNKPDDQDGDNDIGRGGAVLLAIGNVHLESLDNEVTRKEQLVICSNYLSDPKYSYHSNSILLGDFNFDSHQTWGDWKKTKMKTKMMNQSSSSSLHQEEEESSSSSRAPLDKSGVVVLENNVLQEIMPNWVDIWPYLKNKKKSRSMGSSKKKKKKGDDDDDDDDDKEEEEEEEDLGITFDGVTNPICVRDKQERMRYDRIMMHNVISPQHPSKTKIDDDNDADDIEDTNNNNNNKMKNKTVTRIIPESIEMIGTEIINDTTGLKASDHYGLLMKIKIERRS